MKFLLPYVSAPAVERFRPVTLQALKRLEDELLRVPLSSDVAEARLREDIDVLGVAINAPERQYLIAYDEDGLYLAMGETQ